jgi:asparagine synthase (glutamine-hydrolysing)
MPLRNERGDAVLIFSGEDYPEPSTAGLLRQRGHDVDRDGPSYLTHLYEEDPDFPAGLNGLFHGLLADRSQGTATLFNDRYGMHRLYYYESKEAFYFAAEAKAILAVRPELRSFDPKSLGEFVSLSCVLENRTIFKNIYALPGASKWTFRDGAIEARRTYFEPRQWEQLPALDPESYYRELREVFSRNLPRYFNGNEETAVALTGGLDTRAIMAWHKAAPGSLPCYTFGGMLRESQDVRLARRIAQECGQPYQVITVGDEFLSEFPRYAERSIYLTEGSVDVYRSSDLYVTERARQIAPAKIVGTYGSEIIRHAVMFKPDRLAPGLLAPEAVSSIHKAEATYSRLRHVHPVTFAAFRQSPWYHHGVLDLEESQLSVRSPYLDNDFVRTVYLAPHPLTTSPSPARGRGGTTKRWVRAGRVRRWLADLFANNYGGDRRDGDVRLRLIADGSPSLARIPSDRGIGGNSARISSLLSHAFLEFTFKAEYAYDMGMPQWLARVDHFCSPFHLERLFLGRHKLLHFRVWYRDALSRYVQEMLLDSRSLSRPYVERNSVEEIVRGHIRGDRNYTTEIHKLLTLELLHRLFLDNPGSGGLRQCSGVPVAISAVQ